MATFQIKDFLYNGKGSFNLHDCQTKIKDIYDDKEHYEELLADQTKAIDELQSIMFAHDRHALLVIFQAFDAAGKDGTIKAVFQGVNPAGVTVKAFKRPSDTELDHDFLWRCTAALPERGMIGVFNRSYYEEVLVVKVHPEIVKNYQKLPARYTKDMEALWAKRYTDINNFESYLNHNGVSILKIFLNVSKKEQGERQIERIKDETKNWKFEEADIKERGFWNEYQQAYEDMIKNCSTEANPWYIVPADDKKNMRLIVSQIVLQKLQDLDMSFPETSAARAAELLQYIETIKQQDANLG